MDATSASSLAYQRPRPAELPADSRLSDSEPVGKGNLCHPAPPHLLMDALADLLICRHNESP